MTVIAILLLLTPTSWHLFNDRDGDAKEDKATDILIVIAIAFTVAAVGWLIADRPMIDSLILAWSIHFFYFDYAIVWILKKRGIIENNESVFEYLGSGPIDKLMKKLKPWPRFLVRLGVLVAAVLLYVISI